LIGLLAAIGPGDTGVRRATEFLLDAQNSDGSWDEAEFTGTGFPRVFYLRYHLYRIYFPVYALARYRNMQKGGAPFVGVHMTPPNGNGHHHGNGNGAGRSAR